MAHVVEHALTTFFHDWQAGLVSCPERDPTGFVERWLQDECITRKIDLSRGTRVAIEAAVNMGTVTFGHNHHATQLHITAYTFLIILLDNWDVERSVLEVYLAHGDTGDNSIMIWFAQLLASTHKHFTPSTTGAIIAGATQYVRSLVLDSLMADGSVAYGTLRFADHHRTLSGTAEVYALFAFDKHAFPDVKAYIQIVP